MRLKPSTNPVRAAALQPTHYRLWSMAWPLILANITVPLLGLVDAAVLGHLESAIYLGAVAIGANIFNFIYWGFGFLRMGTTGLTAQALGNQNQYLIQHTFSQALILAIVIGLALILLQPLIFNIALPLMQGSEAVSELARSYSNIRIYSAPATLTHYVLIGWMIGTQNSRGPLIIMISANLINIVLDLLFVIGFGWQSDGVAWATLIAEYSSIAIGLALIRRNHWLAHWKVGFRDIIDTVSLRRLLRINRHLFIRTISLLFTFAFFTAQGARQGDLVVAVNAVLLTFLLLISHGLDGFANGAEALVGEAIGRKNRDRFYRAIKVSALWSLLTAALFSLFFWLSGPFIIRLLSDIPAVIELADQYLIWLTLLPLIAMPSYLLDGIFIGATRTREMQNTMLLATFLIFLPVWGLTQGWGNHGLWLALTLFLLFRGASLGLCFYRLNASTLFTTVGGKEPTLCDISSKRE